jgi:hypothetical protein
MLAFDRRELTVRAGRHGAAASPKFIPVIVIVSEPSLKFANDGTNDEMTGGS